MKASLVLALLSACTQSVYAVVQFPFAKQGSPSPNVATKGLKPRAVSRDFVLGGMTYLVNASIGTPGQPVSLVLSPSSSDTWVVDARSYYCEYYSNYYGTYNDDGTYDSDGYYTESEDLCKWGSCKWFSSPDGRPTR